MRTADEWDERFKRGMRWIDAEFPYLDVRAVCVLAALEHWRGTRDSASADRAICWSRQITDYAIADILPDAADVQPIHLWDICRRRLWPTRAVRWGSAIWWNGHA